MDSAAHMESTGAPAYSGTSGEYKRVRTNWEAVLASSFQRTHGEKPYRAVFLIIRHVRGVMLSAIGKYTPGVSYRSI
jgi:hypothetical protein